jgi:hypothetical protein
MYQYSLQYYQALFNLCLKNSEPCEDQARRLEIIIKYSTENCYANICRGLFEKDKTLYSALLVFNILRHADKIPSSEWGLFVRGPGLSGNQMSGAPRRRRDVLSVAASARWRGGSRRSHWLIPHRSRHRRPRLAADEPETREDPGGVLGFTVCGGVQPRRCDRGGGHSKPLCRCYSQYHKRLGLVARVARGAGPLQSTIAGALRRQHDAIQ